jgi:hypothetical protein
MSARRALSSIAPLRWRRAGQLFVIAVVVVGAYTFLRDPVAASLRTWRARAVRAARPRWIRLPERPRGFTIHAWSHWEARPPLPGFGRRKVADTSIEDQLGLRYHDPLLFVAVVRLEAPQPRSTASWREILGSTSLLRYEVGDSIRQVDLVHVGGREALRVLADGAVRGDPYRLLTILVPDGRRTWRITGGAAAAAFARAEPELRRVLNSFRLAPNPT